METKEIITSSDQQPIKYCDSLISYQRRKTIEVKVGDLKIGGSNPIVIQSMTTVDTMDTAGSVAQTIRNSQYLADGSLDPDRLTPQTGGFGSVSSAGGMRTIRATVRFSF